MGIAPSRAGVPVSDVVSKEKSVVIGVDCRVNEGDGGWAGFAALRLE